MKRSLIQILRTNYPGNLKTAATWLTWTIGSVIVSVAISVAVSFARKHYVDLGEGITHGELFAFSASLVIGSGRLILKDEDLEDFVGRQFFGLIAFITIFFSEVFFCLWKLDEMERANARMPPHALRQWKKATLTGGLFIHPAP